MTNNAKQRKETPIARGVIDYFPDAIAEVAHVSYIGNQQHNPGEEMHWDKSKSPDHADCIARHLIERGTLDTDGLRHSAKAAWRALAMLQIEIEAASKNPIQEYVEQVEQKVGTCAQVQTERKRNYFADYARNDDCAALIRLGCPEKVARQIVMGITYNYPHAEPNEDDRGDPSSIYVYLSGPMRNCPGFNFPAFDAARNALVKQGYNVISPADLDRAAGFDHTINPSFSLNQTEFVFRDFWSIYFIAKINAGQNAVVMLRNWERSTGANAEHGIAKWIGLSVREIGEFIPAPVYYTTESMRYRIEKGIAQVEESGNWYDSLTYADLADFHAAIKKGKVVCES